MAEYNFNSIPIIRAGSEGEMIGELCASDLTSPVVRRGSPQQLLNLFKKNVLEFIKLTRLPEAGTNSLTCSPDEKLVNIVRQLVETQSRQVWLVRPQDRKVVGIVSLGDILSIFK